MELGKYSFGHGDRFGRQGIAQLRAILKARKEGVSITPVWNKSYREHVAIGTRPEDVRKEADQAVKALGWDLPYFVDADHVNRNTIDLFLDSSDFFTLDLAEFIGYPADDSNIEHFVRQHRRFTGTLLIPGFEEPWTVTEQTIENIAHKFLFALQEAGRLYRNILKRKKDQSFVVEVSMDETDNSQSPLELLFILSGLANEKIPLATIAPKFTGRFNKGVDYEGTIETFAREFEQDLRVIKFAIEEFGLPETLKLSIHSGSDKFSLYPVMRELIRKHDMGLHLKTAGTTWLEELIGLAEGGDKGVAIVQDIYQKALEQFDELVQPYAPVIQIDPENLPSSEEVRGWGGERLVRTLRHNPKDEYFNPDFRQTMHVSYPIAAEIGNRFLDALEQFDDSVSRNVTENLLERHIRPLFIEK